MPQPPLFSGRWVAQVLDDRGIRHSGWEAIDAFLVTQNFEEHSALFDSVGRLERGVETDLDKSKVDHLLEKCRESSRNSQPSTLPSISEVAFGRDHAHDALPSTSPARVQAPKKKGSITTKSEPKGSDDFEWMRSQGLHIYGSKASLKAELDQPEDKDKFLGQYTVSLDIAPANGPSSYDWAVKVSFQLTRRELPVFTAFLLGLAGNTLFFGNHGPAKNKSLEISNQDAHFYLKMTQGPIARRIQITAPDLFGLVSLCLTAMHLNAPAVDSGLQLAVLQQIGSMHKHSLQKEPK